MEDKYQKNIDQEISEIEKFFNDEAFVIMNENFVTNESLITTKKNIAIDFELKLKSHIHPHDLYFKKLGFSEQFKIISKSKNFIVPPKGVTKIAGKQFEYSEVLRGEISSIYSEDFPTNVKSIFRLILIADKNNPTTKFLGSKYSCGKTHYGLGLIKTVINHIEFHTYRHSENNVTFLVIENLSVISFKEFQDICESTLKSIGFLTGNWYQNEHYIFSYSSNLFDKIESVYYDFFGNSIISDFEIVNPQQFRTFLETDGKKPLLTPLLFPEEILSQIISFVKSKPEFARTIELIIEGNEIRSPLIRCSVFSVALETIVSLIHSENKSFFKPLKRADKITTLLQDLQNVIDNVKKNFNESEYSFLSKKITYLNTPFNKDKYLLAFEFLKIDLPEKLKDVLNIRNKFFHGKTPYEEGQLKTNLKDLNLEADRLHLLVSILILKYSGYRGHVKNQAGYRLEMEKVYEEKDGMEINESALYRI